MTSYLISPYLWIGLTIGCASLFYVRRQIQGYYFDRRAIVSLKDLSGKTAVITGGNSGIGLGAAIHLAKRNANIIIACRNQERATSAVKYIQKQSGNDNVSFLLLDLCDVSSIEKCASQINKNNKIDIDYLILNAGISQIPKSKSSQLTKDGLQVRFQANYFGHWYMTHLLLNKLKNTAEKRWAVNANEYGAPVRIICTSSGGHTRASIPTREDEWDLMIKQECSYGQSKLLQILHMKRLQMLLDNRDYDQMIQCVSVTPGMVRTPIVSKHLSEMSVLWYPLLMAVYPLYWFMSRDYMMGSEVILHCCCNDRIVNGGYYSNCQLKPTEGKNNCSNKKMLSRKVWINTKNLVNQLSRSTYKIS